MVRRVIGSFVGCVAVAGGLSGCLLPLDVARPGITYTNHFDESVIVAVEGGNVSSNETQVSTGVSYEEVLVACVGTGIRVETEDGELIGRVDEQACPDWTLTINEDGSLDYTKDQ